MRIAIDVDSTLWPYWERFAASARRRFGVELAYEDQVTWAIAELRPEQVRCVVEETHQPESILSAQPYPGAVETVRAWHEAGHFIAIASHRAQDCSEATGEWLEAIGLPYDELSCSWDKVAHCQRLNIELLIDDSPINLQRALEVGMTAATLLHPWNRDLCELEPVIAAEDWAGLRERLAPLLAAGAPNAARPR
jgi:uncharacterized HAD superfamily protein